MCKTKKDRNRLEGMKENLLNDLRNVRQEILQAAKQIPQRCVDAEFVGSWSIVDLLAHLEGWDITNKKAAEEILSGKVPSFYSHHDRDWASFNSDLLSQYKKETLQDMIAGVAQSHEELIHYLNGLSAEDIFKDHGVRRRRYKVTIRRLLEAERDDEIEHLHQIEAFLHKEADL
jgi:hypothetical protein